MISISFISSIIALIVVIILFLIMIRQPEGNEKMKELSRRIQHGAKTFLYREYSYVGSVVGIIVIAFLLTKNWQMCISFVIGSLASILASYLSMSIATRGNARTAEGAKKGIKHALNISFIGGAATGLLVSGLGLLFLSIVFVAFFNKPEAIKYITPYAMGASLVALFARAGGGIYTKGADMGADLVGKVEESIPEDDPRNPAVIADNVGDNVGDIAGLGADLLESYVEAIIATITIGITMTQTISSSEVFLPLYLASIGIFASIIGIIIIRTIKVKDPENAFNIGTYSSFAIMVLCTIFIIKILNLTFNYFFCVLAGLICGLVIGWTSEFFTSYKYKPTRELAKASTTGPAVTVVSGISLGMLSTTIPVIVISCVTILAFIWGGLYGIALAGLGMLSILGITLSVDSYGPVADNAGGIAEMSKLGSEIRKITDRLDACGNTTAAIGKGFAIGSAALAALGLITAYLATVGKEILISFNNPHDTAYFISGLLVGGMLPYLFSSLVANGVAKVAFGVIEEVRRQFREIKGLREGITPPDSSLCVKIAATGALKNMMLPGIIAIIVPVIVGFTIGALMLCGILIGALVVGLVLAIQTANSGGAMDNAKKYIEDGHFGGKGSPAHKAAVIGDTVGDPMKDTMGPSLNILIKLMAVISLVIAPFIK